MLEPDLSSFLLDFGVVCSLDSNGVQTTLILIISNVYDEFSGGGSEGRLISAIGQASDLENVSHSHTLEYEGMIYQVTEIRPIHDGNFIELILKHE